ncbi:uncharacterized protein LOC129256798 isoform X1 [Lytechinus pictus]|uniref:uncharacterized protein LOC129256798 isoform X1 n=2 Tax=Lytechinus pictus TaxID=7653 RepID=UPI0030B9C0D1
MAGTMMKFLRTNGPYSPGNKSVSSTGNGNEISGTPGRQRRDRRIPPPLQLVDQADGDQSQNARGWTRTPDRRFSSRRIADSASIFDFYHAYLTEEQEEEAFKHHLFKTGSYLMRDSKSNPQAVTMSVVIDPLHLYHFQVVQSTNSFNVVGTGNQFTNLEEMIDYYKQNNIPGKTDSPVLLKYPVLCNRCGILSAPSSAPPTTSTVRKNGPTTPVFTTIERPRRRLGKNNRRANSVDELPQGDSPQTKTKTFVRISQSQQKEQNHTRPNQPKLPPIPEPEIRRRHELYENPQDNDDGDESGVVDGAVGGVMGGAIGVAESASSSTNEIDSRPPMPIPRPGSEYSRGHDYSEADHPDLDRIKMVLELCRQSDLIHASHKKCTCGLYLEESILVQGWMMHVDNEPGKTQGRIFFLDTKTNTTTWSLPEDIKNELKSQCPVKWQFVKKQLAESKQKSNPVKI